MERHKKNVMRTPEEKEKLISEYRDSGIGINRFACLHDISNHTFFEGVKNIDKFKKINIFFPYNK